MVRTAIPEDVKRRTIESHEAGLDYQETARVLGVKRGTAYYIVRRYTENGVVVRPRGGARIRKMDAAMDEVLVQIVEEHPEWTLTQLKATQLQLRLPHKPVVSIQTLGRRLRNQLIVLKTMETVAVDRDRHDVKVARAAHAEWYTLTVNSNHPPEMVFVDESGVNPWLS